MVKTAEKLDEKLDKKLLDKRVVQRNLEKKIISKEDLKSYLSQLKDCAHDYETVTIEEDELN